MGRSIAASGQLLHRPPVNGHHIATRDVSKVNEPDQDTGPSRDLTSSVSRFDLAVLVALLSCSLTVLTSCVAIWYPLTGARRRSLPEAATDLPIYAHPK